MGKRVIWIILDSVGMGELPDAELFSDKGANTIVHTYEYNNGLEIPNLISLGLGNIDGMSVIPKADKPIGSYGRCMELSKGKDTTVGHWEMCGIISQKPFPTFPDGFPKEVIDEFIKECDIPGILGNCVASGTEIIERLGEEHIKTGKPIVYTSADSVFQIAYHIEKFDLQKLYDMCIKARKILTGRYEVARVIARPFIGEKGAYVRTSDRRDYAILPPDDNILMKLKNAGHMVYGIGKIEDIFCGSGIVKSVHTKNNEDGVDKTLNAMKEVQEGLIFTNLVEFDSTWGHRRDAKGYGKGLEAFDRRIPEILSAMTEEDVLVINADHGCDPTFKGTDHTREYIPLLIYSKNQKPQNLGTRSSFSDIGTNIYNYLEGRGMNYENV